MEWKGLLEEYESSRAAISRKLSDEPAGEKRLLLEEMYWELTEDIRKVRENSLRELQSFLDRDGSRILTVRQMEILTLRAGGLSLGKIAGKLGISKTAVQKSIRLSEKKIRLYTQEGGSAHENIS